MAEVIVDTNILLDLYTQDEVWEEPSAAAIADFYIGAHAAVQGMRILTRDPKRYTSYFPTLKIIEP